MSQNASEEVTKALEVETAERRHVRVCALTQGTATPSARFRVRQYIPNLKQLGLSLQEIPALLGSYPPRRLAPRLIWGPATAAERALAALRSHSYDVTLIQRELISTMATFEALCKRPRLFDVDDAIWIHRHGTAARHIAERVERITCGNSFLAEWFAQWCRDVRIIPTPVDTHRFRPAQRSSTPRGRRLALGWSGTWSGLVDLYEIEDALATALQLHPEWVLVVMCNEPPRFRQIPSERVIFHKWSEERELEVFQSMDIGLMPLRDSVWSRGKCSYKLLIYMACGLPVLASALGMNLDVLSHGTFGVGVRNESEWIEALDALMRDEGTRLMAGTAGRKTVDTHYSLSSLAPRLADALSSW